MVGTGIGQLDPVSAPSFEAGQPGRATELARQALLDSYAPASVVIDRRHQIQYFHGATEDYLKTPSGEPTSNLLALAREGLEALLISAVRQVFESRQAVEAKGRVKRGGAYHPIRLKVAPLAASRNVDDRVLVSFFEREAPETDAAIDFDDAAIDHQLREELKAARDELRLTLEHSEASGEELKASNEEIRAMNEELRVSNEELESSKEELQSLNEELNTVNLQLQAKVEELEGRTSDLNNLLNSTDVATLFLDRNLRIRWFTPAMKNLLELLTTDIGRPVYHFSPKFTGDDFVEEAKRVLQTLQPSDAEVVSDQDRWYLRQVMPYRTDTDRIDGVVVTFIDISEQRAAAARTRRLAAVLEDSNDAITLQSFDGDILAWNKGAERMYGHGEADAVGRPITDLIAKSWAAEVEELLTLARQDELEPSFETRRVTRDGRELDVWLTLTVLHDEQGKPAFLATTERDITERKAHERSQQMLIDELNHRVRNTLAIVNAVASQSLALSSSLEAFGSAFQHRLQALAETHTLLSETQWTDIALEALIEQHLSPYGKQRAQAFTLSGPDIVLSPKKALTLGLVIHELATNAAKYGALSTDAGQESVTWQLEEAGSERRLRLTWQERGGPPVQPPSRRGFGTQLIDHSLDHEFDGHAAVDYDRQGISCELIMSMTEQGNGL